MGACTDIPQLRVLSYGGSDGESDGWDGEGAGAVQADGVTAAAGTGPHTAPVCGLGKLMPRGVR